MKIRIILILVFKLTLARKPAIIEPFTDIVGSLFIQPQILFDVVIYKSTSSQTSDIINGIGSLLNGRILSTSGPLTLSRAALIFTQNCIDLQEFFNNTMLENFGSKPLRFLIHSKENYDVETLNIPSLNFDEGHVGHFSYFTVETKTEIQLLTFEWFTPQKCHIQQSVLINTYNKQLKSWSKPLQFHEKFRNFHNCPMNVFSKIFDFGAVLVANPYFITEKMQTSVKRFEHSMMQIFAQYGNFEPNHSSNAGAPSLDIFYLLRSNVLNDECQVTSVFWNSYDSFYTSLPEPYDSFEKMFLTFDYPTWICLGLTVAGGLIVIFIVSRMSRRVQDLFFGEEIKNPWLNVIGLFYGLGQTKLPRNNFARIILVTYIMFCLVIGTAWHGVFFELMTKDVRRPLPKTIQGLRENNFTLYASMIDENQKEYQKHVWNELTGIKLLNTGFMSTMVCVKVLSTPSAKGAYVITSKDMMVMKSKFKPNFQQIPEVIMSYTFGIGVMKNNFIFEITKRAMDHILENGIPQYFLKYLDEIDFHAIPLDETEPKIFTVDDLAFGFYVFLVTCAIALLAFVGELSYFYGEMFLGLLILLNGLTNRKIFPCGDLRNL